jgi:hypothetical protein
MTQIEYKCPKCNETENLHYNYDYSKQHRPISDVLCNSCGTVFEGDIPVAELTTKPGFVERRMKLMEDITYREILSILEDHEYEEVPNSAIYKFDYEKCAKALVEWYKNKLEQ